MKYVSKHRTVANYCACLLSIVLDTDYIGFHFAQSKQTGNNFGEFAPRMDWWYWLGCGSWIGHRMEIEIHLILKRSSHRRPAMHPALRN
jgi:hypothetical protein